MQQILAVNSILATIDTPPLWQPYQIHHPSDSWFIGGDQGEEGRGYGVLVVTGGEGEELRPHNKLVHEEHSDVFIVWTRKSQDPQCPQKILSVPVNVVGLTRKRGGGRT